MDETGTQKLIGESTPSVELVRSSACVRCCAELLPNDRFCAQCGGAVSTDLAASGVEQQVTVCPACDGAMPGGRPTCQWCGHDLTGNAPPVPPFDPASFSGSAAAEAPPAATSSVAPQQVSTPVLVPPPAALEASSASSGQPIWLAHPQRWIIVAVAVLLCFVIVGGLVRGDEDRSGDSAVAADNPHGLSPAELAYNTTVLEQVATMEGSLFRVGLLMDERLFSDADMQASMNAEFATWDRIHREAQAMPVPPRFVALHADYLEMLALFVSAADDATYAVEYFDPAGFESGTTKVLEANRILTTLPEQLEASMAGPSQPNGDQQAAKRNHGSTTAISDRLPTGSEVLGGGVSTEDATRTVEQVARQLAPISLGFDEDENARWQKNLRDWGWLEAADRTYEKGEIAGCGYAHGWVVIYRFTTPAGAAGAFPYFVESGSEEANVEAPVASLGDGAKGFTSATGHLTNLWVLDGSDVIWVGGSCLGSGSFPVDEAVVMAEAVLAK